MASVTHQALLMRSAAYVPTAGWFQPLSVVPKTTPRAMSSINADGAWLAALAFAATGVKGIQWQQPLSIPVRTRRDLSGFNSDGAWLAAIRPVAVAGGVAWQQPLSVPIARSNIQAPSIVDPSSFAQAWISAAAHTDPFWGNVVLLMGFEGADAATGAPGMTDESPAQHGTATAAGNAQIDTAQFKFGSSSLLLDGVGDCIKFADHNDFNLGSGSFTIECRIRPNSVAAANFFIMGQWNVNPNLGWLLYQTTAGLAWNVSTTGANNLNDISVGGVLSTATWFAVCMEYNGSKYRLYLDGTMIGSSSTPRTIFDSSLQFVIGANSAGGSAYNGWIDEVRITKGVARYASDSGYTPSTTRFPR